MSQAVHPPSIHTLQSQRKAAGWSVAKFGVTILRSVLFLPLFLSAGGAPAVRQWLVASAIAGLVQALFDNYGRYVINRYNLIYRHGAHRPGIHLSAGWATTKVLTLAAVSLIGGIAVFAGLFKVQSWMSGSSLQTTFLACALTAAGLIQAAARLRAGVQEPLGFFWKTLRFEAIVAMIEIVVVGALVEVTHNIGALYGGAVVVVAGSVFYARALQPLWKRELSGAPQMRHLGWRLFRESWPLHASVLLEKTAAEGLILLLAAVGYAPAAVALTAALRTAVNAPVLVAYVLAAGGMPPAQHAVSSGRADVVVERLWRFAWLGVAAVSTGALGFFFAAPALFKLWTRGRLPFDAGALALLAAAAIVSVYTVYPATLLRALNRVQAVLKYNGIRAAAISAGLFLLPLSPISVGVALLCAEAIAGAYITLYILPNKLPHRLSTAIIRYRGLANLCVLWSVLCLAGISFTGLHPAWTVAAVLPLMTLFLYARRLAVSAA